ncbi:MAG: Tm-1-like ATP-binding domain-containing protein [Mesorhizobium sp.]
MAIQEPRILLIGTGDTKSDEMIFMSECIREAGGTAVMMDVSVLGEPNFAPDVSKHDVAAAAGTTIAGVIASGDENSAMALMAAGSARLARGLYDEGRIDGALILGGTMGTDLALDVAAALPLGVPKFVVSTISYSHLIPPERISTDLMMILWAGGLYGLNGICRSVLSQASGAVVGAARTGTRPQTSRPLVGMTSLGKSCLSYMVALKPALEERGYEVAVFHTTGMGGRAFESVAAERGFAAVMDFCLQEIVNHENGVLATSSGRDRLENAARMGIPQIVAPGAVDMVDLPSWAPLPERFADRPYHAHNRLLGSVTTNVEGRRRTAASIARKLEGASAPVAFILPVGGIQQWDQEGEPLHDPEGLSAFLEAMKSEIRPPVQLHEIADHINSPAFAAKALRIFDDWVAEGIIPAGVK